MSLDPQMVDFMEKVSTIESSLLHRLTPEEARQSFLAQNVFFEGDIPVVGPVYDRKISCYVDIPIRVYTLDTKGPHPVLIYYHGGGWVQGNLDTHDGLCRWLTYFTQCIVISVDYRLAPEHPFPAAVEDAYAAAQWIFENAGIMDIDPNRMAVGGDSAGANLATVVSLMSREKGDFQLIYQVLYYPNVEFSFTTSSFQQFAEGYLLTRDKMHWFSQHYLGNEEDAKNPYAAPLLAKDVSGLPPAFIVTAEYDPLRDEGKAYAEKLKEAGVSVVCKQYKGMVHGFIRAASVIDQGKQALQETAQKLHIVFGMKQREEI